MPEPLPSRAGPLHTLGGLAPRIDPTAWIAPNATIIGDVEIGPQSSVWFNCILRGDTNVIRVGARTNIQDATILHVNPGEGMECLVGDDITIGHMAVIHACVLRDRAFVGIGAIVLDGATIESGGVLAAGGVLTPGKRIGPNELWAGTPAKLVRVLTEAEQARFRVNAPAYVANAERFRAELGL